MSKHRQISGLISAKTLDIRPKSIPLSRPRGIKAKGIGYERELEKAIPVAKRGQWFEFKDSRGWGYCQPDFLLEGKNSIVVLEAKYTWTLDGHLQIEELYQPVVEKASGKNVLGIVVCKRLVTEMPRNLEIFQNLLSAVESAKRGKRAVLHWIGAGQLWPPYPAFGPRINSTIAERASRT